MNIKYHRINENELSSLPFNEGSMYFCKDTGKLYADPIGGGGTHILINDNIDDEDVSAISTWSSNKTSNEIKKSSPVNLLDNSNFTNLIAQAGLNGTHCGVEYAADRWRIHNGSISGTRRDDSFGYTDISISHTTGEYCDFYQRYENYNLIKNKKCTVAFKETNSDTIYTATFIVGDQIGPKYISTILFYSTDAFNFLFRVIDNMSWNVEWIAIYEGEYTADTIPKYNAKSFIEELTVCQYYYENSYFGSSTSIQNENFATCWTNVKADGVIEYKTIKRKIPSVNFLPSGTNSNWMVYNDNGWFKIEEIIPMSRPGAKQLIFRLTKSSTDTSSWVIGKTMQINGHWEASADL